LQTPQAAIDPQRGELLLQAVLAQALAQCGTGAPTDRVRLLERLGRYRWGAGDLTAAVDATEQAVALLPPGPPSAVRARVLAALATRRMLLGEFGAALPVAERAVEEAEQAGAVAEQAHGLATLGIIQAQRGEFEAGMAALRDMVMNRPKYLQSFVACEHGDPASTTDADGDGVPWCNDCDDGNAAVKPEKIRLRRFCRTAHEASPTTSGC